MLNVTHIARVLNEQAALIIKKFLSKKIAKASCKIGPLPKPAH
jgi:hypothetical protein